MQDILTQEKLYIKQQNKLISKLDLNNRVSLNNIRYIAGVDLAYWEENNVEYAVCCIVVTDYQSKDKKVVEKKHYKEKISVPYIPGCLAFREIPLVLKTVEQLEQRIDLFIFDGNGYLHPRHMGLATHAGILLNKPSIGIAKTYFKVNDVDYVEPDNTAFSYTDIIINNEVYGRALRTHSNVKPVFLSVGNQIDINTATEIAKTLVTKESHIPIPTRLADIMTHEKRKEYISNIT